MSEDPDNSENKQNLEFMLVSVLDNVYFKIFTWFLTISTSLITLGSIITKQLDLKYIIILLIFLSVLVTLLFAPRLFPPRIPIFEYRMKFMNYYLKKFLRESKDSVVFLNIASTWFSNIEDEIKSKIEGKNTFCVEFLLLKRIRIPKEQSYFALRERDEGLPPGDLVKKSNITLYSLFRFLLKLAEERPTLIHNFRVREYKFMPVMCEYIFDGKKIVFGPYISKDCNFIPLFEIKKNSKKPGSGISLAFGQIEEHYRILRGDKGLRQNDSYVPIFSYWDGDNNKSIHKFIEKNTPQKIERVLEKYDDIY
ncbi:MAG: hypothetical protein M0Q43_05380, partial [Methanothrix sp.]|nr:hypothetical protein [Methanothrix sp.]